MRNLSKFEAFKLNLWDYQLHTCFIKMSKP